jgi:hypothetical protein
MTKIIGNVRPGSEFQLTEKPTNAAQSTFTALVNGSMRVTRRLSEFLGLPDDTPVLAHWHGQWRTDGFATSIGELREMARAWEVTHPPKPRMSHPTKA